MSRQDDEFEHQSGGSGASDTIPQQCSALRKNGHVMIKGRPCKIIEMSTSKTGKHGHAKVHLVGLDIFTGKKLEDICPSTHNMPVPNVSRIEYLVMDIEDGHLELMEATSDKIKSDLKLPNEEALKTKIIDEFGDGEGDKSVFVTVLSACGEEQVISMKVV